MTVVASLPTNPSRDITANIPIDHQLLVNHLKPPEFDCSILIFKGLFSVHFMAEIRLYSQWQIISFFPNFCPKIPNSKDQEICYQTKVFRGIKAR